MRRRAGGEPSTAIVLHADWSVCAGKRWLARAERTGAGWRAAAPEPVPGPAELLRELGERARSGAAVALGLDLPIGVPEAFAAKAGIERFRSVLPELGHGEWERFTDVAERAGEVSPRRPFYPRRPGGARFAHLLAGLGIASRERLLRRCERARDGRPAASPLFWTLGARQVGKAAITGWRDLIQPALRSPDLGVVLWPFDGDLADLFRPGRIAIAETYPAEAYRHVGVSFSAARRGERHGKTVQADRAAHAPALLGHAQEAGVALAPELRAGIRDGFGSDARGEDRFDALVGLFGMLEVVLGRRREGAPGDPIVRRVEGWILGQQP